MSTLLKWLFPEILIWKKILSNHPPATPAKPRQSLEVKMIAPTAANPQSHSHVQLSLPQPAASAVVPLYAAPAAVLSLRATPTAAQPLYVAAVVGPLAAVTLEPVQNDASSEDVDSEHIAFADTPLLKSPVSLARPRVLSSDRQRAWNRASVTLAALKGGGMRELEADLTRLQSTHARTFSMGRVVVVCGYPGTGKSTLARIFGDLLYGAGLSASTDTCQIYFGTDDHFVSEGAWIADDCEDLLADESFRAGLWKKFSAANSLNSATVVLVLIGGPDLARKLPAWVNKCECFSVLLHPLTMQEMVDLVKIKSKEIGMRVANDADEALRGALKKAMDLPIRGVRAEAALSPDSAGTVIQVLSAARYRAMEHQRSFLLKEDFA